MSSERDKILAMVEEGTISAEEANELLEAMDVRDSQTPPAADFSWPEMPQRGQAWQRPFTMSLFGVIAGGTALLGTRKAGGLIKTIRIVLIWPLTLTAAALAIITYFNRESPWIHVRVKARSGEKFTVSLPFPSSALQKALRFARDQADDEEVREKIDAAAEILTEMDTTNLKDPLVIDISDEGDSIQVFLN